jgi:hypothetical protein
VRPEQVVSVLLYEVGQTEPDGTVENGGVLYIGASMQRGVTVF